MLRVATHPKSERVLYTAHVTSIRARRSLDSGASLPAFDTGLSAAGGMRDLHLTADGLRALLATSTGTWARGLELVVSYCPALPPAGAIAPGSGWNFQYWFRDSSEPPAGFDLSDALHAVFVP